MDKKVSTNLEYRLAGIVSLGLLIFCLLAGSATFYFDFRAELIDSANTQDQ
jgi:hypothetical protein